MLPLTNEIKDCYSITNNVKKVIQSFRLEMYMKPPLSIHRIRRRALTSVSKRVRGHATPQGSAGVSNNASANKRERKQPQGSAGVSNNASANKRATLIMFVYAKQQKNIIQCGRILAGINCNLIIFHFIE